MYLGHWFDLAIFICGAVAALGTLALALEMRAKMSTGLPAAPVQGRNGNKRGSHFHNQIRLLGGGRHAR